MAASQTPAARRIALIRQLAPDRRCACCGRQRPYAALQIDHVDGCTWSRRDLYSDQRIARYEREFAEGVRLRVLCLWCNRRDGAVRLHTRKAELAGDRRVAA